MCTLPDLAMSLAVIRMTSHAYPRALVQQHGPTCCRSPRGGLAWSHLPCLPLVSSSICHRAVQLPQHRSSRPSGLQTMRPLGRSCRQQWRPSSRRWTPCRHPLKRCELSGCWGSECRVAHALQRQLAARTCAMTACTCATSFTVPAAAAQQVTSAGLHVQAPTSWTAPHNATVSSPAVRSSFWIIHVCNNLATLRAGPRPLVRAAPHVWAAGRAAREAVPRPRSLVPVSAAAWPPAAAIAAAWPPAVC